MMRLLLWCCLLGLLSGCARSTAPAATPAPAPTTPAVGELLAAAPGGTVEVIGYLLIDADGARLADRLGFEGATPTALGEQIWLESFAPPPDIPLEENDGVRYAVARVRGLLDGPGSFGPGGRARFQIVAPQLTILTLRELTIPLLLGNSQLYEGQAVRLSGQILASPSSTLLVERLGPGGVPSADALPLKLVGPLDAAELGDSFSGPASGAIRYGPAHVVGIWRGGALYPLSVRPGQ